MATKAELEAEKAVLLDAIKKWRDLADWQSERLEALEKSSRAYMDTVSEVHHALADAGWHPGRTDDRIADIIKAKGKEMRELRASLDRPAICCNKAWGGCGEIRPRISKNKS